MINSSPFLLTNLIVEFIKNNFTCKEFESVEE